MIRVRPPTARRVKPHPTNCRWLPITRHRLRVISYNRLHYETSKTRRMGPVSLRRDNPRSTERIERAFARLRGLPAGNRNVATEPRTAGRMEIAAGPPGGAGDRAGFELGGRRGPRAVAGFQHRAPDGEGRCAKDPRRD